MFDLFFSYILGRIAKGRPEGTSDPGSRGGEDSGTLLP